MASVRTEPRRISWGAVPSAESSAR